MKTCLICSLVSESDLAATCPACGEGSWSAPVDAPSADDGEPAASDAPTAPMPRGRRAAKASG